MEKELEVHINKITFADLKAALGNGWADFKRAPVFGIFFGGVYALGGILLTYGVFDLGLPWLAYPIVIGFALIGPFVATGLYEVSRNLEACKPLRWRKILSVIWDQHRRELGWMAFVMLFIFWIWMYQVRTLVAVFFGTAGFANLEDLLTVIFTTEKGFIFLIVGHLIGAIISLVLFSITVISCPLLLDREVDFVTAMLASIRTVYRSPIVMIMWGISVVLCVLLSAIPAFLGLVVSLPILGHTTWHLYRRVTSIQNKEV